MIEELDMQDSVSGYGGLKAIAKKPDGGFCFIRVRSLLAAWVLFKRSDVTLYDLRAYIACFEMQARRCQIESDRLPTFTEEELISLLSSGSKTKVKNSIRRLMKVGLLQWDRNSIDTDTTKVEEKLEESDDWLDAILQVKNNNRKIPFPRRILRYIIKTQSPTLIGAVFGILIRGLYYKKGRCISGGRCKTSWIAIVFRLNSRNLKRERKRLIEIGWLIPCESSQHQLNRWGLALMINLHWQNSPENAEVTPLEAKNDTKVPPPIINEKLSYKRNNNQKLRRRSGVQNRTGVDAKPSLKNIMLEDLRTPERLERLFHRAVSAGIVPHSESSRLAWFSAAEHALQAGRQNPCGLFVAIYRQELWHHITQDQEDRAGAKIKRLDFGEDSLLPGEIREFITDHRKLAA
jgi:hypothetical protein